MGSRGRAVVVAIVAAACAVGTSAAWAAPGDRDTTFANGAGFLNVNYAALVPGAVGTADTAEAVAVQPDGKIVVVGSSNAAGTSDMALIRLTTAGALDTSYGLGTGGSRINFGGLVPGAVASFDAASSVALQPDGKIVIAGATNATGTTDMAVVRLNNPQGTLDSSYGLGTGGSRIDFSGLVPGATGKDDRANALVLQPDGKIVLAGFTDAAGTLDMAVARLNNPQGTLDASYGLGTGGSRIDFGGLVPNSMGSSDNALAVALQPDGKIVLAGHSDAGGKGDIAVVRLNAPAGTLDSSYGLGTGGSRVDVGVYISGGTSTDDIVRSIAIQPDGKILVGGSTTARGTQDFAVVRLRSPEGTLDPSFGADGHGAAVIDLGGESEGRKMALQANGKILVAGTTVHSGQTDPAVIRLQPNGTLDTSFGDGGERVVEMPGTQLVNTLAIAPDGKIVVGGTTGETPALTDMFALRLQGDPPSAGGGPAGGGAGGGGGGGKSRVPRCAGKRATVIGTNGKNRLKGTKRADVIVALGGNDSIDGRGGNDLICAGGGDDKVAGGDGKDRLYGQSGKDSLKGGPGNDSLDGGAGNDRLSGQSGKDTLRGRTGRDRLSGGPGKDKQKQ